MGSQARQSLSPRLSPTSFPRLRLLCLARPRARRGHVFFPEMAAGPHVFGAPLDKEVRGPECRDPAFQWTGGAVTCALSSAHRTFSSTKEPWL